MHNKPPGEKRRNNMSQDCVQRFAFTLTVKSDNSALIVGNQEKHINCDDELPELESKFVYSVRYSSSND